MQCTLYTEHPAPSYAFDSNRPTHNDWSMTFLYGDPKRKRVQSKHFTLYANCASFPVYVSVSVCVCVWLTENDKLIQSLPRLSIFITPHVLSLCSCSSSPTAPIRGSALYRVEQKVHSCELHFHLYRNFIASRPSEILFTLHSFTHVSHTAAAPDYDAWLGGSGLSCCSCCFDSFWHTARRRPMVSSRPASSASPVAAPAWRGMENLAHSTANKKLK